MHFLLQTIRIFTTIARDRLKGKIPPLGYSSTEKGPEPLCCIFCPNKLRHRPEVCLLAGYKFSGLFQWSCVPSGSFSMASDLYHLKAEHEPSRCSWPPGAHWPYPCTTAWTVQHDGDENSGELTHLSVVSKSIQNSSIRCVWTFPWEREKIGTFRG